MKYTDETRFEFRRFGTDLSAVRDQLAALGNGEKHPERRETYIVTRLNIESNVKIRNARLEVKGLVGRLQMLEQWKPVLKAEFPVSTDAVENIVVPALGLDLELGSRGAFTESALLAALANQPALATVRVEKQRTLFDLGTCTAEFAKLKIDDDKLETIAFEAVDADAEIELLRKLGLEDADNESYAAFLQRRLF
jgi:hypothetical protein